MKSFKRYITDELKLPNRKFVNVPTKLLGKNNNISKEIYDMIEKTYRKIGGYPDFKKYSDLPDDHTSWLVAKVDKDPEADIVRFGKPGPGGMKMTGSASDGSEAAKAILINKTAKMLNTTGNYAEMSDAMAHIMITRKNVPFVANEDDIKKLLPNKVFTFVGENPNGKYPGYTGWYKRKIGGKEHLKIMLGKPIGAEVIVP